MLIIPAIDIKNGKCVRLTQGDFDSEKIYNNDPVIIAKQWEEQGATMIHVVDLDGAKSGTLVNLEVIKNIVQSVNIPIQVGGGIRNKETVKALLSIGVSRVVLGTVALEDREELKDILKDFALQVAVALDTKNGKLMKQGWIKNSDKSTVITALELERLGVQKFIYTDVVKDGTLTEPNYKEIANLTKNIVVPVIISGGISTIASIKQLKSLVIEGIILGKALYENKLTLKEAINVG
jgi:phosphoribosylformimino-5-aminoimidazole carboxamide ribotide isomerase